MGLVWRRRRHRRLPGAAATSVPRRPQRRRPQPPARYGSWMLMIVWGERVRPDHPRVGLEALRGDHVHQLPGELTLSLQRAAPIIPNWRCRRRRGAVPEPWVSAWRCRRPAAASGWRSFGRACPARDTRCVGALTTPSAETSIVLRRPVAWPSRPAPRRRSGAALGRALQVEALYRRGARRGVRRQRMPAGASSTPASEYCRVCGPDVDAVDAGVDLPLVRWRCARSTSTASGAPSES